MQEACGGRFRFGGRMQALFRSNVLNEIEIALPDDGIKLGWFETPQPDRLRGIYGSQAWKNSTKNDVH